MTARSASRPLIIWLALAGLTLLSVVFAERAHWRGIAIVAMFVIAAAKGELVLAQYMEIGAAERHWRILYRVWLGAVTMLLIAGNLFG